MPSTLDIPEATLLLLQMFMSTCHSSPFQQGESYIVTELDLVPTGLLHNNIITCPHLI